MTLTIRPATLEDAPTVHGFIVDLAVVQGARDQVLSTVEDIARDGFGPGAMFHSILAENQGEAIGFASFYLTYSTWQGRSALYVEDIIVNDAARGLGVGTAMLRELARITLERGCSKMELSVRAENTARAFYERLGMTRKGDWLPYTIAGPALDRLASAGGE